MESKNQEILFFTAPDMILLFATKKRLVFYNIIHFVPSDHLFNKTLASQNAECRTVKLVNVSAGIPLGLKSHVHAVAMTDARTTCTSTGTGYQLYTPETPRRTCFYDDVCRFSSSKMTTYNHTHKCIIIIHHHSLLSSSLLSSRGELKLYKQKKKIYFIFKKQKQTEVI